ASHDLLLQLFVALDAGRDTAEAVSTAIIRHRDGPGATPGAAGNPAASATPSATPSQPAGQPSGEPGQMTQPLPASQPGQPASRPPACPPTFRRRQPFRTCRRGRPLPRDDAGAPGDGTPLPHGLYQGTAARSPPRLRHRPPGDRCGSPRSRGAARPAAGAG